MVSRRHFNTQYEHQFTVPIQSTFGSFQRDSTWKEHGIMLAKSVVRLNNLSCLKYAVLPFSPYLTYSISILACRKVMCSGSTYGIIVSIYVTVYIFTVTFVMHAADNILITCTFRQHCPLNAQVNPCNLPRLQ